MQTTEKQQEAFFTDPQIAGNYRLLRRLGQGAMGQVYLAEQIHVGNRPVALKVMKPECAANPQLVKRFETEAATAGRIQHRNVVTIYESRLTEQGNLYVAMEFVAGRTLRDELADRGALPINEVIEITNQICAGLHAAHKHGVVHRDIKPDNIMLLRAKREDDGLEELTVKVLDFGIARLAESQQESMHTAPGLILGTPAYLSPEQAAGAIGNKIDARADIYSLGMVVYEMLTGRVAFQSDSWLAVVRQQMYDPPPAPSRIGPGVPSNIEQVVMQALEKDRERRPQTALLFARDLGRAYAQCFAPTDELVARQRSQSAPISATRAMEAAPPPVNQSSSLAVNWKSISVLATLALILAAAAFWIFNRKPESSPDTPPTNSPASAVLPPSAPVDAIRRDVMTYRITRKQPFAGLRTLPLDLSAKSDERILFEFKLNAPGAVYLIAEQGDHSWRWLDASENGQASVFPAGRWIELPRDSWYVLDNRTGAEVFWLLCASRELNWSLAEAAAPAQLAVERGGRWQGSAAIEPATVDRLVNWLKTNGKEMNASGTLTGDEVQFSLWQEAELNRVSFHRIELKHTD